MNQDEFISSLLSELDKQSESAVALMIAVVKRLPEKAKELHFVIFPGQDGDGFFSVRASLSGPDLYVLNKAISDVADILDPRFTEEGVEPDIPIVSPFAVEFSVNDLIVDCVSSWLERLWVRSGISDTQVPVYILGHDDYGTETPIQLC